MLNRAFFALAIASCRGASATRTAQAQSLNDLGVKRLNEDAQAFWSPDGLATVRAEADKALQALVGVPHTVNKKTTATITKINSITIDCPVAPGLTRCDGNGIGFRVPLEGDWHISANVDVSVKGKLLLIPVDRTYKVDIDVRDINASIAVDLDSSDPAEPKIKKLHPAKVDFKVKVRTSSWVMNFVSWITRPLVNGVAQVAAFVGARYLNKKLNVAFAGQPKVLGAGGPALAPVAPPKLTLEKAALALETDCFQNKMPHGSLLEGNYDKPYTGTWEDSLTTPGFTPGTLKKESTWAGDSGEYTCDLLAAVSFRYGVTKAPDALARTKQILATTRTLLTMRGEPGNMNRCIAPYDPAIGPLGEKYLQKWNGVDHVFSDYMSRDEYTGLFFGLGVAYDVIDDKPTRAEAQQQFEWALDYLVKNNWTWRKKDGSWGERWAGCIEQQYGWVVAAYRMNPTKYRPLMEQYKGFADLIWAGVWSGVVDPFFQYYKFGLSTCALDTALRNEQDPVRWQRTYQGLQILRRYVGHHQNAQFDVTFISADPSSRQALGAETENLLTRWLRQPRRFMTFDLTKDPTIEQTDYKPALDTTATFAPKTAPPAVKIAKYPVAPEKRISATFLWCRSPYSLVEDYIGGSDPYHEGESVDFTYPYWEARYFGAVK